MLDAVWPSSRDGIAPRALADLQLPRGVEPLGHVAPVPDVPDRLEELRLAILVLEVVGVLPGVDHHQRHASYLQYQNRKTEFFEAVWNVWNWSDVAERFDADHPDPMMVAATSVICLR